MMKKHLLFTLPLLSIITTNSLLGKMSFDRLYGFFGKYTHEAIVEKEFELKPSGHLVMNNNNGNITITTEWQRNTICLKATKRTTTEEDLELIHINAYNDPERNQLTISSAFDNNTLKGCVDYELIVPAQTKLQLNTDNGSIKVNDAKGEIVATTLNGDIEIHNTSNTITAQTEDSGAITIVNAQGNIKATTNKGNITIQEARKSIIATTQNGNIITDCAQVPSTSRIVLNAESSGAIDLKLPSSVNASVHGKTNKGRLTSDHFITLKPLTTQLTRQTRRELEKQVDGILGTGEADIRIMSKNGNIRILETKVS